MILTLIDGIEAFGLRLGEDQLVPQRMRSGIPRQSPSRKDGTFHSADLRLSDHHPQASFATRTASSTVPSRPATLLTMRSQFSSVSISFSTPGIASKTALA